MSQAKHRLPTGDTPPSGRHWAAALVASLFVALALGSGLGMLFGPSFWWTILVAGIVGYLAMASWFYLSNRPPENKHERN